MDASRHHHRNRYGGRANRLALTHAKATLPLAAVCAAIATGLSGCGGIGPEVPPAPTAAVAVIDAVDAETKEPLAVDAIAICGGVRGTITPAEGSVVLRDVPFGTGTPPVQPLTVTAPGYVTFAELIQINTTVVTFYTVELQPADPELTGTVSGKVVDSKTGAPIVSALVRFAHTDVTGTTEVRGYTDAQGAFIVGGIPIGVSRLTVEAPNYVTTTDSINVVQDSGGSQNPVVTVKLLPGSTVIDVSGTVVDAFTNAPLSGVRVTLGTSSPVLTDTTGEFAFTGVTVGSQELHASLSGYDDYTAVVEVLPGMARLRVAMTPSAPQPPETPFNVRGTVTLIGAADNSGAVVVAVELSNGREWARCTTPASGNYTMFIPPGEYRLTASYGDRSVRRTVTVPGGGRVLSDVDFVLTVQ